MKPVTKIDMKPSTLKEDDKVKEKEESEEPPKWFLSYAAVLGRIENQLKATMEKVDELKEKNIKKEPKNKEEQMTEQDEKKSNVQMIMNVNLRIFVKSIFSFKKLLDIFH